MVRRCVVGTLRKLAVIAAIGAVVAVPTRAKSQITAATCPSSYPLPLMISAKPDLVNPVDIALNPPQSRMTFLTSTSHARYAAASSEPFKMNNFEWWIYYNPTYEAVCGQHPQTGFVFVGPINDTLLGQKALVAECDNPYTLDPSMCEGGGAGDGGSGGSADEEDCENEYIVVEVWTGESWEVIWEGNATVCE